MSQNPRPIINIHISQNKRRPPPRRRNPQNRRAKHSPIRPECRQTHHAVATNRAPRRHNRHRMTTCLTPTAGQKHPPTALHQLGAGVGAGPLRRRGQHGHPPNVPTDPSHPTIRLVSNLGGHPDRAVGGVGARTRRPPAPSRPDDRPRRPDKRQYPTGDPRKQTLFYSRSPRRLRCEPYHH